MSCSEDPWLSLSLENQRRDAAMRRESLGPVVEAVGALRATTAMVRCLLDEMESQVGVHLELLDLVLREQHGNQWWEALGPELGEQQ